MFTDSWFSWQTLRREVIDAKKAAEDRKRWLRIFDGVLSLFSAGLAASAGAVALKGATNSTSGTLQWVIFGLSIASALVSAAIVLFKPAEKAKVADKEAVGIEQLGAAMDVFQEGLVGKGTTERDKELEKAKLVVRERLRAAKGLAAPRSLL